VHSDVHRSGTGDHTGRQGDFQLLAAGNGCAQGLPVDHSFGRRNKLATIHEEHKACCNAAKLIVLGKSEPMSGAGLALPQNGFRVLLQPGRNKRASRAATGRREVFEMLLLMSHPVYVVE